MNKRSSKDLADALMRHAAGVPDAEVEDFDMEEVEELADEAAEADEDFAEELEDEDEMDSPDIHDLVGMVHEDGIGGFMDGLNEEDNPYTTDDQDLMEVWLGGWVEAFTHACVTDLVLSVKALLEAKDAEEGDATLTRLTESFGNVTEVLPIEECEEFWAVMQEEE